MTNQISMADMLNAFDPATPGRDPELLASLIAGLKQLLAEATVEVELAEERVLAEDLNEAMTQKASGPHTLH
ncbi:hypothetical protein D3C84_969900 [compost metagenome]